MDENHTFQPKTNHRQKKSMDITEEINQLKTQTVGERLYEQGRQQNSLKEEYINRL